MLNILENLENDESNDMLKVSEFIGVIADENTAWESLQVGELKAMLYLALGDMNNAKEWVVWCKHMAQLDESRSNLYRCLDAILDISINKRELSEYRESLEMMYGVKCVENSIDIINAKEVFFDIHSPGLSLEGFSTHQSLLEAYEKVHKAKQEFYK